MWTENRSRIALCSRPLALVVAGAWLAACGGSPNADAGDARSDTGAADVFTPDTFTPDDTGNNVEDAAPDVADASTDSGGGDGGGDGGACTGSIDPMSVFFYDSAIEVTHNDVSAIGGDPNSPYIGNFVRDGDPVPPEHREGDCIFHAIRATGSDAKNAAPAPNLGRITVSASPFEVVFTHGTMMGVTDYTFTVTNPMMMPPNVPYTMRVEGEGSSPAGTATNIMPNFLRPSDVPEPEFTSRTQDLVVTWRNPAGVTADVGAYFWVIDMARNNVTICAAPACRQTIRMPASFVQRYPTGTQVFFNLGIYRQSVLTLGSRRLTFRSRSSVLYTPIIP